MELILSIDEIQHKSNINTPKEPEGSDIGAGVLPIVIFY